MNLKDNYDGYIDNSNAQARIMEDYKPFEFSFKMGEDFDGPEAVTRAMDGGDPSFQNYEQGKMKKSKGTAMWQLDNPNNNTSEQNSSELMSKNFKKKNAPGDVQQKGAPKSFEEFQPTFKKATKNSLIPKTNANSKVITGNNKQPMKNNSTNYSDRKGMSKTSEAWLDNKSNPSMHSHKDSGTDQKFRRSGFNYFDGTYNGSQQDLDKSEASGWELEQNNDRELGSTVKTVEVTESYLQKSKLKKKAS